MPVSFDSRNYDLLMGLGNITFNQNSPGNIIGNVLINGIVVVGAPFDYNNNSVMSSVNIQGNLYIQGFKRIGNVSRSYLEHGYNNNILTKINSSYIKFHNRNYLNNDVIGGNIIALNGYINSETNKNGLYFNFKNICFTSSLYSLKTIRINCVLPFNGSSSYYVNDPYILDIYSIVHTKNFCMKKLYIQLLDVNYIPSSSFFITNDGTNVYFTTANNSTYSLNNGYFGIMCNPSYTLDVDGTIQNNGGVTLSKGVIRIFRGNSTITGYIRLIQNGSTNNIGNFNTDATSVYINAAATSRNLSFFTNNTRRMTLLSNSNFIGIGTASPTRYIQLSTDSAAKPSTSTWTVSSDMRLKEDIELADISLCYSNIKYLKLKRWKWRDDIDPTFSSENLGDRHKLGWIAQDVSNVIPKSVDRDDAYDISGCLSLNADQIYATLYGCVEKIIQDKEKLENTVIDLQNKIDVLKIMIQKYKAKKNIS